MNSVLLLLLAFTCSFNEIHSFNTIDDLETAFNILERRGEALELEEPAVNQNEGCSCCQRIAIKEHMKIVSRVKREAGGMPCWMRVINTS